MNAMTIASTVSMEIPDDATQDQWLATGRELARMKDHLGFMIGDWVNHGRKHFPEQLDLLIEQAGFDPRASLKAARVAEKFPAHVRNKRLSFDHHRVVHMLPAPDQLDLLQKAGREHWDVKALREAVVQKRYESGDLFDDEDVDATLLTIIIRDWNRATPQARKDFLELAALAGAGIIDEDQVYVDA
jgi:hypothetical protein